MYWVCTFVTRKLEVIFHWLFGNPFMSNQYKADLKWISDSVLSIFCSHANLAANFAVVNDRNGISPKPKLNTEIVATIEYK